MFKGYKYRIYPNKEQKRQMANTFGCVRFVYNHYLDAYKKSKKVDDLETLRSQYVWLKDVDPKALEFTFRNLEKSYRSFLNGKIGPLKFKRKKDHRTSYVTKGEIKRSGKYIKLPGLGMVKTKNKFEPQGRILNATISQAPSGRYYASLCCEEEDADRLPAVNRNVGIKLGIENYLVLDNGTRIPNPKYFDRSMNKISRLDKELKRKKEGGSNWEKTRIRLARAHEHVANQRRDFLQKLSTGLVRAYDHIYIEDLPVQNMRKNCKRGDARDMWDAAWAEFIKQLQYKSDWYGRGFTKVKKLDPDTQICNCCGESHAIGDDVRLWVCPKCGALLDRDINAAINILNKGVAKAQIGVCTI